MATRVLLAAAYGVAALGVTALATLPGAASTPQATCSGGEEPDTYTTVCTPYLVPNSPSLFQAIPGNPDIPAIDGIPCTGHQECIGLAEEEEAAGPRAVPRSTISASPTVTGHSG